MGYILQTKKVGKGGRKSLKNKQLSAKEAARRGVVVPKRGRGRPPMSEEQRKSCTFNFRLRPAELRKLRRIARARGESVQSFVRSVALAVAAGARLES